MAIRSRRLTLLATTVLGVFVSPPAMAAAAGAEDSDTIVGTARRVEERLQDVPISITVFTPEQISNRNIYNAGDLGTYTPSLSTNSRYGAEKSTFAIRGFTQENNTSPSVGVYFAEVVAPRAAGGTASGNGAGVGSFFDLANIQVLKGPQGTLFGRNTTGGAILLVPQRPTDKLEGFVEGTIGNYGARRVQAVLNLPLSETFRVRLGVDRNTRDGYLKNHSGIGAKDFADTNYTAARLSIIADLTPDLENYTLVSYSNSDTNGPVGRLVACNRASPSPFAIAGCAQLDRQAARGDGVWDVENDNPTQGSKLEQWQVINTTSYQASDTISLKNIVSYAEFREKSDLNIDGDNFVLPSLFGPIAGRPFQLIVTRFYPGFYNAAQSTFTEELQLHGRTGAFDWQVGGYMELSKPIGPSQTLTPVLLACTDSTAFQCTSYFGTSAAMSSASFRTDFRNLGIYAQGTYKFSEKLSLTGGIRYTSDRVVHTGENISIKFMNGSNNPRFFCGNLLRFPGPALPGLPLG
jgi:iron complex outermembrane receptor protein